MERGPASYARPIRAALGLAMLATVFLRGGGQIIMVAQFYKANL